MRSWAKITTTTRVYNVGNYSDGGDGKIIKETNTKVQMVRRSQLTNLFLKEKLKIKKIIQ